MGANLAHCGLLCSECGAYRATVENDGELREKTAEEWSKMFGADIRADDINCLGCHSEVLFGHCHTCDIRKCSLENNHNNCSECASFECDRLEYIFKHDPRARERLEQLKG